jgi:hypothetical protein
VSVAIVCRKRAGGSRNTHYAPEVVKALVAVVLTLAVAGAAAQAASDATRFARFRTPSKNIGCLYARADGPRPGYLRCDILSGVKPAPSGSCRLDWTGFSMVAKARARPTCAGDTVYDSGARILRYGSRWRAGGFVCRSRRSGLRCTNAAGRGFSLSRARSYAF